ncbi:unnamed protein product [Boreogadus saida]
MEKKTPKWSMFPQLTDYLHANNLSVAAVKEVATSHLTALSKHFKSYFADVNTDAWDWVRDPFAPGVTCSVLTSKAEDELVDLSCDRTLKARFQQVSHVDFWPFLSLVMLIDDRLPRSFENENEEELSLTDSAENRAFHDSIHLYRKLD